MAAYIMSFLYATPIIKLVIIQSLMRKNKILLLPVTATDSEIKKVGKLEKSKIDFLYGILCAIVPEWLFE